MAAKARPLLNPDQTMYILPPLLLVIGGLGGFLSGLLGVGGGIIFVPALFFSMTALGTGPEQAMHLAVGTSLAVVFATGATSALAHHRRGAVDSGIVRAWGAFIVGGVIFGSLFASSVDGRLLKEIFAVITFAISLYMAFGSESKGPGAKTIAMNIQRGLCACIGMVSSMIGVGGAILTVPMMSYIGVPMQRAVGTGAALGMLISLPGCLGYMLGGAAQAYAAELPPFSVGYVNVLAALMIIPSSILLAPMGVKASHKLPRTTLRRVFAGVLMLVSIRMFMTLD
ncbi:MAG: sulfite exporter TauE/SafE family protein [Alphaproteobacteria bacterium]